MSATEKLRRLLDKRGVEHDDKAIGTSRFTEWDKDENYNVGAAYVEYADGCVLRIYDCTPEQAIATTLGSGECEQKWVLQGTTQTQEFWRCECGNCGESFGVEDRSTFPFKMTIDEVDVPNFCPNCGARIRKAVKR